MRFNKIKFIIFLALLSLAGNSYSQLEEPNIDYSQLSGKWIGFLDSNDKKTLTINIQVVNDSVFGYSSVQWTPSKVGSEIFRGKVHKRKNSIILYEPAESKNAATYECSILLNNGKYALEGVWTSKKENKIFYCRATKVADLTYAIDEPESTIRRLIESINTYSQNRNEDVLKNAYLLWLNPDNRVGVFNSWKLGFSNTLSDSIPKFSNIPDSLKGDVSQNPQKIEGYSGVFAI